MPLSCVPPFPPIAQHVNKEIPDPMPPFENMRKFYSVYGKSETLSRNSQKTTRKMSPGKAAEPKTLEPPLSLSWSHYLKLMRIDDEAERRFYEIETVKNNWGVRELKRQFDSALYERLIVGKNKGKIKELSENGQVLNKPEDATMGRRDFFNLRC